MRIGIVGFGSIGQRHARCLKQLGCDDIFALRTKKGTIKNLPVEFNYIKEVFNPEQFYSTNLDAVIISNPTNLHIETMKIPLEKVIPIFLEKPIADSMDQIEQIEDCDVTNVVVGFMLRHNELINAVKHSIDSGRLGRIYKAHLYCGHYLPFWHRYADYKKEYYSRRELGGGVLRTLCHEIDLMHYFFGIPNEIFSVVGKISDLEIDVDDNALLICKMPNESLIMIEVDFINPTFQRYGEIVGSEGKLKYSFENKEVVYTSCNEQSKTLYKNSKLQWNQMFVEQMQTFVNFIRNGGNINCTFQDGINVMKEIEAAEISTRTKTWQKVI